MTWAAPIGWGLAGLGTLGSIAATQDYARSQRDMIEQMQGTERVSRTLRTQDRNRKRDQMIGQQAAMFGASGVTLEGSPMAVMADTSAEVAREQFNDDFNSNAKQAAWDLSKRSAQRSADMRSVASLFNFGANALIRG
ncbi:MAG: hypothetical protein H9535_19365 [Ignavibacteria bacterium]|nr:hypothetical protein [Ignavibacteria bacterium]